LRYTPAGLPALDCALGHRSEVVESGQSRRVELQIRAVGIGDVVPSLSAVGLGDECRFGGFIAAGRQGRGLVFHITSVDV
jgi:primosomal replication protein N